MTAVLGLLTLVLTTGLLNSGQIRADLTDPISLETTFAAADPLELLPNLNLLKPQDIQLSSSNGKTLLRFSMTSWNSGDGALEFVATGEGVGKQMNQRIYNDDGSTYVDYPATAISFEWHAAHGHFHVKNYANYDLKDAAGNGESKGTGSKTTFCIIDTDRINHKLPGASKKRQYSQCNGELQGMSVGWGDTYPYYLAGQEIDVTGLDTGDYRLIIDVNLQGHIKEKTLDDNSYEILLRIDIDAGTVEEVVDGDGGGGQGNGNGGGGQGNGRCPHC